MLTPCCLGQVVRDASVERDVHVRRDGECQHHVSALLDEAPLCVHAMDGWMGYKMVPCAHLGPMRGGIQVHGQ